MENINDIIQEGEYKKPLQKREFNCMIKANEFKEHFLAAATQNIHSTQESYIVDNTNKHVINQLYYYLINAPQFTGSSIKGILLIGAIGGGKTVLMESFISVFNEYSGKIVTIINSKNIVGINEKNGYDFLHRRPLFIDDIGKEQTVINTYGTVSKPMEDLINDRYKTAGLTFGTSNLTLEDMPYNKHTIDRMRQMFNIIVLPGKSRR